MFNDSVPPGRSITFTFKPLGVSDDLRFYNDHPESLKNKLDALASGLFDPEGGQVFVIGFHSAGKSFLIEQFAGNVDQYLSRTAYEEMHFVDVSRNDGSVAEQIPNGISLYLQSASSTLNTDLANICFVTESPDFAAAVYAVNPKVKVILELNISTFMKLDAQEASGASKIWKSWFIVDVNEVLLPFEELVATLNSVLIPKLKEANIYAFEPGEIEALVEFFLEQMPEAIYQPDDDADEDAGAILIPPGVWGSAVRKLATLLAYSHKNALKDEGGAISFEKAVEEIYAELEDDFAGVMESIENVSSPQAMANLSPFAFLSEGGGSHVRVFTVGSPMGEDDDDSEESEIDTKPIEFSDITTLEARLQSSILGQDQAVRAVVEGLSVPVAGIHDQQKPVRSFLFLGPTGVGKTQLALNLAEEAATSAMNVIRLDMSEYAQAHEASKLLGAPSGYVGYEEGGVLTNAVLANPRSVIILDEVEKAHFKIWDSFLQILDAGRMTDNKGEVVDFTQTIIVMTSNLGAKESKTSSSLGFGTEASKDDKAHRAILASVEEFFRPEMINRIDEMIYFNELSQETAREIVRREIAIVSDRMAAKNFKLAAFEDDVVDELIKLSSFSKYGARDIQRAVIKNVSQPLAMRMLASNRRPKKIALYIDKDQKIQVK